jgi:hypothetical protein
MKKTYYGADDLRGSLDALEGAYTMASKDFYAAYVADDESTLEPIPGYHRFTWAAFYDDWLRLNGNQWAIATGRGLRAS